ncbi:hypothetical protein T552_02347 [Pneumocystis carinii B80]|uniref:Uncharacterized protein n=1 Tax=Pneumocystis carinii (strain B80) TaxID=1408658 RepID=A0A0W4ZG73_PNEC8|nr:hypothetical protein T552_02347 [Pneumocystis carinii B80]KTW27368.1 hypothetical protein T552_02347 [Pneumocystis carinii B80]
MYLFNVYTSELEEQYWYLENKSYSLPETLSLIYFMSPIYVYLGIENNTTHSEIAHTPTCRRNISYVQQLGAGCLVGFLSGVLAKHIGKFAIILFVGIYLISWGLFAALQSLGTCFYTYLIEYGTKKPKVSKKLSMSFSLKILFSK